MRNTGHFSRRSRNHHHGHHQDPKTTHMDWGKFVARYTNSSQPTPAPTDSNEETSDNELWINTPRAQKARAADIVVRVKKITGDEADNREKLEIDQLCDFMKLGAQMVQEEGISARLQERRIEQQEKEKALGAAGLFKHPKTQKLTSTNPIKRVGVVTPASKTGSPLNFNPIQDRSHNPETQTRFAADVPDHPTAPKTSKTSKTGVFSQNATPATTQKTSPPTEKQETRQSGFWNWLGY